MAQTRNEAPDPMIPLITMSVTVGTGDKTAGEKICLTWAVLDGQPESSDWIGIFRGEEKLQKRRVCCTSEKQGGTVSKLSCPFECMEHSFCLTISNDMV